MDQIADNTTDQAKSPPKIQSIKLVSYPKIVFFYPSAIVALLCAILTYFGGAVTVASKIESTPQVTTESSDEPSAETTTEPAQDESTESGEPTDTESVQVSENKDATPSTQDIPEEAEETPTTNATVAVPTSINAFCGRLFLSVLFINLVIIGFDFPRTTSLTLFFGVIAAIAIVFTLGRMYSWVFPAILSTFFSLSPFASTSFYFVYFLGMLALFITVLVTRRFDYWEVRGNELLHHTGIVSNMERYPSPNLRIDKEINDVFEYLLLKSGKLTLHPSNERRSIVLENVVSISKKEDEISAMLRQLDVRFRPPEV